MSLVTLEKDITLSIAVSDRHKSALWYQEKLGFELVAHFDEAGWSELKTRTESVTLGLSEHLEPAKGTTVPVFGVKDISTARAALEAASVEFAGETEIIEGMVSTAMFYDLDGNMLMLAQDHTG